MQKKVMSTLLGLLLLMFVVWVGTTERTPVSKTQVTTVAYAPKVGYQMPPIALKELPNGSISMNDLKGKPVFINFWASWCTYCRLESPDIAQVYKKFGSKVIFLSINATSQDTLSNAKAFMKKYGMNWPVALDTTGAAARKYDIVALPASFFVDRNGVIVGKNLGPLSHKTLYSELERIAK
ncbi:TlpA disulfide reductase family protein [Alicyclobacillus sp. SO9]|uniref:TlpA family protein disulfide reductase n=1 Tax=Alicyclobacillus sp. SO9 TaxID=2665646 RepID=UPI0018E70E9A|nr:TlpA disulfide reductase family protein [Alicyclobacillus sp. SO9]QQE77174.1 TlpA family protein disulfide reductase [Alicyclobacillus sp. SO9]